MYILVTPDMQLKPNCDSDRAWIWSVPADFADETPKPELLAVRFANAESKTGIICLQLLHRKFQKDILIFNFEIIDATRFKEAFEEAQKIVAQNQTNSSVNEESDQDSDDGVGSSEEDYDEKKETASEVPVTNESKVQLDEIAEKLDDLKVDSTEKN